MKTWVSNLEIRRKMLTMMLLAAGGAGLLGLIQLWARSTEADLLAREQANRDRNLLIERIALGLLQARRSERDFMLMRETELRERHRQETNRVRDLLGSLGESELETDRETGLIDSLDKSMETYASWFEQISQTYVTVGLDENSGLQGSLRASVHAVEEKLNQFDKPRLGYLMLMMRRHEKDFLMRLEQKYIDRMAARKDEFETMLPEAGLPDSDAEEIRSLMDAYHRDFVAMAEGWLRIERERGQMDATFERMLPDIRGLRSAIEKEYRDSLEQFNQIQNSSRITVIVAMVVIIAVALFLSWLIGSDVRDTVTHLARGSRAIADGDLDTEIDGRDRGDELGLIARTTETFRQNALQIQKLQTEELARERAVAEERQEANRETSKLHEETHALVKDFEERIDDILTTFTESTATLQETATHMSSLAEASRSRTDAVNEASEITRGKVEEANASVIALASSITEISNRLGATTEIADRAVEETLQASDTVSSLADTAREISAVVELIHKIAVQTNLLALNATIEAAHAGEAGRGFGVVAEEIKKLSGQTANALAQITEQVAAVQTGTDKAVTVMGNVNGTIRNLDEITNTIAQEVAVQDRAKDEIAENVAEASRAVGSIATGFDEARQRAVETRDAAESVLSSSDALSKHSVEMEQEISKFLARIDHHRTFAGEVEVSDILDSSN